MEKLRQNIEKNFKNISLFLFSLTHILFFIGVIINDIFMTLTGLYLSILMILSLIGKIISNNSESIQELKYYFNELEEEIKPINKEINSTYENLYKINQDIQKENNEEKEWKKINGNY